MLPKLTPVVRALLYSNVIVYLLQRFTWPSRVLERQFALWPIGAPHGYQAAPFEPWQIVTYAFLHDPSNWLHIFSNMLALYMFGPAVEQVLGSRRFSFYYFACVIGAALAQLIVVYTFNQTAGDTLGASGGIFGLLLFFGLAFPNSKVLVYFAIPMPAWLFVTLYGLWELGFGVFGINQGIAHFAHLGGMATGLALIVYWRARSTDPRPR